MGLQVKISIEEEKAKKAMTYYHLLTTNMGQMPDPYDLTNWLDEGKGKHKWPKVFECDVVAYMERFTEPSFVRKRTLSDYKVIKYILL